MEMKLPRYALLATIAQAAHIGLVGGYGRSRSPTLVATTDLFPASGNVLYKPMCACALA